MTDAIVTSAVGIRKAAADLVDAVGPAAGAVLDAVRGRLQGETDPGVRASVAEAAGRLERVAERQAGRAGGGAAADPDDRDAGADATRPG